jgi:hypothetical protein
MVEKTYAKDIRPKPIEAPKGERFKKVVLNSESYKAAREYGLTYSQYLEAIDPSYEYSGGLGELDAFERQLYRHGLATSSDKGIKPIPAKYFFVDEAHRIIFKEFLDRTAYTKLFDDRYNVNDILATTRQIVGESAKGVVLNFDEIDANPYVSIGKGAEIPTVRIGWSDTETYLAKKGVAIEWTYEAIRRFNIDTVRLILERVALADKRNTFMYAAGFLFDGAPLTKTIDLDSTVTASNLITYKAWLSFLETAGAYTYDVAIGSKDAVLKVLLMDRPNIDPSQVMSLLNSMNLGNTPKLVNVPNFANEPRFYVVPDGTFGTGNDDKLLLFDSRYALERIVEQGSDISETDKFIKKQIEVTVQTLNEGFNVFFDDSRAVLHLSV